MRIQTAAAALHVEPVAQLFRALGDATRVRIVALLAHGELCNCHVEQALGLTQPNASRQLRLLKTAGILESRRAGNWTHYRLARQLDERRREVLRSLVRAFSKQELLRRDVQRLLAARKPWSCP